LFESVYLIKIFCTRSKSGCQEKDVNKKVGAEYMFMPSINLKETT
jgi:hypothetical protein